MVRTIYEESIVCGIMREKYFENPHYRKWSEIIPPSNNSYGDRTEYNFFIDYVMGDDNSGMGAQKIYGLLDNGHNLPIDWQALYTYFDERFADEDNCAVDELTQPFLSSNNLESIRWSIMDILNHYRESLLNQPYDII